MKILSGAIFVSLFFSCLDVLAIEHDVYLLAGQSNMDGRGAAAELSDEQLKACAGTIIYYRNPPHATKDWESLAPGFSIPPKYKGELPSTTFGPEIGFAATMSKARPDRRFALIKGSKGGTSLRTEWVPGLKGQPDTQGPCYRDFIETIHLATEKLIDDGHTYKICGLLWHQGESDKNSAMQAHQERLEKLIERIREDVEVVDLPIVLGEVFDNGKRDNVRAALKSVGTSGHNLGFVTADSLTTWDNGTHFDAASQLQLGQRYAESILELLSDPQK